MNSSGQPAQAKSLQIVIFLSKLGFAICICHSKQVSICQDVTGAYKAETWEAWLQVTPVHSQTGSLVRSHPTNERARLAAPQFVKARGRASSASSAHSSCSLPAVQ